MPPIDPDAPWWVNTILLLVAVAASATVPVVVSHMSAKRRQEETQATLAEVREQVANTHTTNLRADIDLLGEAIHRMERYLEDTGKTIRSVEHSLDRRTRIQEGALEAAIEDRKRAVKLVQDQIPATVRKEIRRSLAGHVTDCPLRTETHDEDEMDTDGV